MIGAARVLSVALIAAAAIAVPEPSQRQAVPAAAAGMIGLNLLPSPTPAAGDTAKPETHMPCACLHRLY